MNAQSATPGTGERTALVAALLRRSGYESQISKHAAQITRLIAENDQLSRAVEVIAAESDFANSGKIAGARARDEIALINEFFEYIYFASDDFIESALR